MRSDLLSEMAALRDDPTAFPPSRKAAALAVTQLQRRQRLRLLHSCVGCGQVGDDSELTIVAAEYWHPACRDFDGGDAA